MAAVPEEPELFLVRVERGGPWDWSKGCASRSCGPSTRTS